MELTRRQEIMVMLREREWTLDELARNFVVSKKVIINDLEHIARSLARGRTRHAFVGTRHAESSSGAQQAAPLWLGKNLLPLQHNDLYFVRRRVVTRCQQANQRSA